ncbi:MAG: hypothetical protein ACTSYI_05855 [Promethearchaeota archaeon]
MEKSPNKYVKKFSIFEIRAAKLTMDQIKKKDLVFDRRRKTLNPKNVEYLKQLGLPEQYTGPGPKAKVHVKAPKKFRGKTPEKPAPSKTKPKAKKEKKAPKPAKIPKKPAAKKPAEKKKIEKKAAEKKPVEKKKVEKKTVEKKKVEKNTVEKKKIEKKTVEKKSSAMAADKTVEPNVLQAVVALFEATPLFDKKPDLMEAIEAKVAGLSKLTAAQIFDSLKIKEIIHYSRTAPRGYSLNL